MFLQHFQGYFEQILQNYGFYFALSIALYGVRFKSVSTEEVELTSLSMMYDLKLLRTFP